jgi:polyisoprenoid-binding protein YceI
MTNLIWSLLVAAALPANGSFQVDPAASAVRYTVVHKLHRVEGTAGDLEARAVVKDDGQVLAMVRLPVTSLRSGDANRDEHMLEVLEAGKFPFVVLKGVARLGASREIPAEPVPMQVQLQVHGVDTAQTVPLELKLQPDGTVRVRGAFVISLDAHRVQRPSLLFVKIDDDCRVAFDLLMREGR